MDKVRRKEQLNFEMKKNPVLQLFNKLDGLVKPILEEAFDRITKY